MNKLNECNKKRLFGITREFTEISKKYLHQLYIDEGRDKDVYPFELMKAETKMSILLKVKEIVCYSVLSRSELKKSIVSLTSRYLYLLFLAIART